MTPGDLAAEIDVKRPRDLTRRKNLKTGKGRDAFVTRLADVGGVLEVTGDSVCLREDWLEALDREREDAGEGALPSIGGIWRSTTASVRDTEAATTSRPMPPLPTKICGRSERVTRNAAGGR